MPEGRSVGLPQAGVAVAPAGERGLTNSPVHLTSFVGREGDLESLAELVVPRRLVTVTGPGGSGKSRVAGQLTDTMLREYPDGAWWVDLAPLTEPALVVAALSNVLGIAESQPELLDDAVVTYLRARRALVVLDNCEHLVEAAALLAASLLEGCPAVAVVATSREPLGVPGETIYRLAPLSLPNGSSPEALECSEAGVLFIERARACLPSFRLTAETAPPVAEICTRLDGIPLAVELAAARIRLLTPRQIADGLADRFRLLTGGARWALPRHRTLAASLDWSHDLLDERQRALFRRLAVFAGTFTMDGARTVCGGCGIDADAVLGLLGGLVDQSLVQVVANDPAEHRYRLLDTVREYANRELKTAGEHAAVRDRHLEHCLSFAAQAAVGLEGGDLLPWLARVDREVDNVRAAVDWSIDSSAPDRGARLVGLLTLYWFARSDVAIGRARLEAAVDRASSDRLDRAAATAALAIISYRAGDMASAERHGDAAVDLARRLDDIRTLARALHWRGWARCWGASDRVSAWRDFEEARVALSATDDHVFHALNLALLAWSYLDTSEAPRARPLLDEALATTHRTGALHAHCYTVLVRGDLELIEGHLDAAVTHLDDALALSQRINDHYAGVFARGFLGSAHVRAGRYEEARRLSEDGLREALDHGSPMGEGLMRLVLGSAALAEGALDRAAAELEHSAQLFAPLWQGATAMARSAQAAVALARADTADARRYAAEALELATATDIVSAKTSALVVQARLARADGEPRAAEHLAHEALAIASGSGHRAAVFATLDALADAVSDQGRHAEAVRLLSAADAGREARGHARYPVDAASHEVRTERLRDRLGTDAFARAWAEGAALTLEDVVAYARRGRGGRKRPDHGWGSLTPAELQVVELVADGLTNPQIGDRLFISRRTVQSHLAHVFAKLGVSTRAELAAGAAQRRAAAADPT